MRIARIREKGFLLGHRLPNRVGVFHLLSHPLEKIHWFVFRFVFCFVLFFHRHAFNY